METNNMKFYRYEAVVYAVHDHDGELVSPRIRIPEMVLHTYNLHKETPKGYWIGYGHPDNGLQSHSRWVSKTAKKRYAYPTKGEALNNYIKRTEKRIKILKGQLEECEHGLMKAKAIVKPSMNGQRFEAGDEVKLPFNEKGEIVNYIDLPWSSRYNVKITESNGFNEVGEIVDFFDKNLELIKK